MPRQHHAFVSTSMVVGAIVSVQVGAAIAATMFDEVGAMGMVFLRLGLAAIILCAWCRPTVRNRTAYDWKLTAAFGALMALLSLASYAAVDRLPLGLVVTLELLGPLGLAAAMSRRLWEIAWTVVALLGVFMLTDTGDSIDALGVVFALVGAASWAGYILLSAETGRRTEGLDGLALAIAASALMVAPLGIAGGGTALLDPWILLVGTVVALMTSVLNFAAELAALRQITARAFGVLMSLNPAFAALAGFVVLDQRLGGMQIAGIALVVVASAATVSSTDAATDRAEASAGAVGTVPE
ncbi:MAG: EamA family transporter [Ilumatobacteraceae bacterium]